MTVKLNLTVNEETAKRIKRYAEKRKISVSKMTEAYYASLLEKEKPKNNREKSWVEKYAGIAKGKLANIDKIRDEYLKEKYGT